jgi:hypothetical protein
VEEVTVVEVTVQGGAGVVEVREGGEARVEGRVREEVRVAVGGSVVGREDREEGVRVGRAVVEARCCSPGKMNLMKACKVGCKVS